MALQRVFAAAAPPMPGAEAVVDPQRRDPHPTRTRRQAATAAIPLSAGSECPVIAAAAGDVRERDLGGVPVTCGLPKVVRTAADGAATAGAPDAAATASPAGPNPRGRGP